MNKRYSILLAFSLLLLLLHSACAEDKIVNGEGGGKHTVRLTLSVSTIPISETKAAVRRALPGSEAESAGFSYELVSSDADTTVLTKAPTTLKNVYALLFTSTGVFNGRADLGTITSGTTITINFENVVTADATGCRLVIVANDNAAATSYSSSGGTGGFTSFSGTYAQFQALTMTNAVSSEADIPYAGSVTSINLVDFGATIAVPLYRTLAKITLNNTFSITSGPERSSITLYNAGTRCFATAGSDNYNGTGTTVTASYVTSTSGNNANSTIWYVGENIQSAVSGITSIADRNSTKAPKNACYIRIASATSPMNSTNPAIGEEYITGRTGSFTYDIYLGKSSALSDFSLRRHTNYTITSNVSGSLAEQEALAARDGRVTLSKSDGVSAGLNIGKFGGASSYTTGTGAAPTIRGSYTKNLLLQPNTSGTTVADNVTKPWSGNVSTLLQTETRKYWDPTYTLNNIDKTSGQAYDYCYNLVLGGVSKGTWYLPSQAQLGAIRVVFSGLKNNSRFANYSAFNANVYWSSPECSAGDAWYVYFSDGTVYYFTKTNVNYVRCVRDLP